jgi:uncharacterized protein YggE
MRYLSVIVFCITTFSAAVLPAQIREPQPAVPEIVSSGRGDVLVTPDRARLAVTVETRGESASQAASNNAATIARTVAALRSAGAEESDIKTSGYFVWTDYEKDGRRVKAFGVRNTLRVEVRRIGDLGKFVDAALSNGATQLQPVQFFGQNIERARHEAIAAAISRARGDAQALAEASGGTLGDVISLTSTTAEPGLYDQTRLASAVVVTGAANTPTSIAVPDLTVSATAFGRWRYVSRKQ